MQCGVFLIPSPHLSFHGVSKRQHLNASTGLLPSVSAFALGEEDRAQDSGQQDGEGSASSEQSSSQHAERDRSSLPDRVSRRQRYLSTGVVRNGNSKMISNYFLKKKCLAPTLLLCIAPGENHRSRT